MFLPELGQERYCQSRSDPSLGIPVLEEVYLLYSRRNSHFSHQEFEILVNPSKKFRTTGLV